MEQDRQLLVRIRLDSARLGCAVLLKATEYLGYPPRQNQIDRRTVDTVAKQLGLDAAIFRRYKWKSRLWDKHLALVRQQLGCRPMEHPAHEELRSWIQEHYDGSHNRSGLLKLAIRRCRELRQELPQEAELWRLLSSGRRAALEILYRLVFANLSEQQREALDKCLGTAEADLSVFELLKTMPGKPGKAALLDETKKLARLQEFGLTPDIFSGVPERLFRQLRARARAEDAYQMRRHPTEQRLSLLAILFYSRIQEVTDQVVSMFLDVIRKIEKRGEKALGLEMTANLGANYNSKRLFQSVVKTASEQKNVPAWKLLLKVVGEEKLETILGELSSQLIPFDQAKAQRIQQKFRAYRQMVAPLLHSLSFRASSPKQTPLMKGLELIQQHAASKQTLLPANVAIPQELLAKPRKALIEKDTENGVRYSRTALELCVLSKLEKAIKCKEIWVHGAYRFRDPSQDLPADWESRRAEDYQRLNLPSKGEQFVAELKEQLSEALKKADQAVRAGRPERAATVRKSPDGTKARIYSPKPLARDERVYLKEIKARVQQHYGMLDLLDILLEADRQVEFSRFFQTSGQRQVLGAEEIRRRLLLVLFRLGTNLGLRRFHAAAKPDCSYDDLRYFLSRFVRLEALSAANVALVNRILAKRNPGIWGPGTSCASDGKHLAAWDRNPVSEWHPHYTGRGVMVYWHVSTNAVCIHSQVKAIRSTDVAPMLHGLVHHDTEMQLESNYVDSHGQSEVAFAFCRLLGFELLPRLKRIRAEKLFVPSTVITSELAALTGVLGRAIRWERIAEQYDDMVRHAVAIQEGIGPTESILRRFNSNNRTHPTYKALSELGKVEKTLFLCRLLTDERLGAEIHEALQGMETWNSGVEFICFGRKTELQSNDPTMHELSVGAIHLLQNALVLSNTLMVEKVLEDPVLLADMQPEDQRALTPLFFTHVNPYGDFDLDLAKPSFLVAA
jgi:TnpA family transposase